MKSFFYNIGYLFIFFSLNNHLNIKAENYPLENFPGHNSVIFVESNKQSSDLENSVLYAEGDVIITNTDKKFIAKSKKAILYKLVGKIKLIGNVEVLSSDMNQIKAGEVIYSFKENKFEAISDENQKVSTKFIFNENNKLYKTQE